MTTSGNEGKRCKHIKANGEPCLAYAIEGSDYCYWHDPATAAQRSEANQRGGRNSRRVRYIPSEAGDVAIQTPGDVLTVLENELNTVLQFDPSLARARTVGFLVGHALKALEVAELATRIEALEAATFGERSANNVRHTVTA